MAKALELSPKPLHNTAMGSSIEIFIARWNAQSRKYSSVRVVIIDIDHFDRIATAIDEDHAIFPIQTEAVQTKMFWLEKFRMQTRVSWVQEEVSRLFGEALFEVVVLEVLFQTMGKSQDPHTDPLK